MLLALHRETGKRRIDAQTLQLILAGAVLAELALAGSLEVRNERVFADGLASETAFPDAFLRIAEEEKPRRPQWWVEHLQNRHHADEVCRGLAAKGILKETDSTLFGFIHVHHYPESKHDVEANLRARIQRALDGETPDDRTASLIALCQAGGLLRKVFPEATRDRIREIIEGNWTSVAVKASVDAVAAALATAVVVVSMGGGS